MTVPSGITLGLKQHIQPEFGGAGTNVRLSAYYAGAGLVPPGTVGFPTAIPGASGPHAPVAIPSSGTIKMSNFYGSNSVPPSFNVFPGGIYSGSADGDNIYFGGDIPRAGGVFQFRASDTGSVVFTVPLNFTSPIITISSFGVWCAVGYTYESGWYRWRYRTTYYYDYMTNIGMGLYLNSTDTLINSVINSVDVVGYTGSWTLITVPQGTITGLTPGETYRLRYRGDFRRDSDVGYGDVSFGWSNNSTPTVTVAPQ